MSEITKLCINKGFLIQPDLLKIFEKLCSTDQELASIVLSFLFDAGERILTSSSLASNLDKILLLLNNIKEKKPEKKDVIDSYTEYLSTFFHIKKYDESATKKQEKKETEYKNNDVKIIESYLIQSKKIEVGDFVRYFRTRFLIFRNILQEHTELQNLTSINKIIGQKQNISIIGIVLDKRITKNKNILFEVEDLTGRAILLVNSNKEELFKKAKDIVLDEVVGFRCSGSDEILFVNDIIFPETKKTGIKRLDYECYAAFTSDLHVGSQRFLEENFKKFIKWLNMEIGSKKQREIARKVKYLFIVGDTIDGVGVYPNQEELLEIKDVRQQYSKLAALLSALRKDISIILCPGQHDAVRLAEPQPPLDKNFASPMHELSNLYLVSNPATVNIASSNNFSGFDVLMYHGASFHGLIDNIEELRLSRAHETPSKIIKYILQKRHLSPTHSETVYIPMENKDPLSISHIPDIIVTGELHRPDIARYGQIISIQCSCWQTITPFEEKVGNNPDPCKVPLLNLKTQEISMLDFS